MRDARDDWYVLPLCQPGHHQESGYGLHDGEETWVQRHGSQADALDVVDMRLRAREEAAHGRNA